MLLFFNVARLSLRSRAATTRSKHIRATTRLRTSVLVKVVVSSSRCSPYVHVVKGGSAAGGACAKLNSVMVGDRLAGD